MVGTRISVDGYFGVMQLSVAVIMREWADVLISLSSTSSWEARMIMELKLCVSGDWRYVMELPTNRI